MKKKITLSEKEINLLLQYLHLGGDGTDWFEQECLLPRGFKTKKEADSVNDQLVIKLKSL